MKTIAITQEMLDANQEFEELLTDIRSSTISLGFSALRLVSMLASAVESPFVEDAEDLGTVDVFPNMVDYFIDARNSVIPERLFIQTYVSVADAERMIAPAKSGQQIIREALDEQAKKAA